MSCFICSLSTHRLFITLFILTSKPLTFCCTLAGTEQNSPFLLSCPSFRFHFNFFLARLIVPAHGVTYTDIKVVGVVVTVEVAVKAAEWFAIDAFGGREVVYDRPNVVDDLGGSDHFVGGSDHFGFLISGRVVHICFSWANAETSLRAWNYRGQIIHSSGLLQHWPLGRLP